MTGCGPRALPIWFVVCPLPRHREAAVREWTRQQNWAESALTLPIIAEPRSFTSSRASHSARGSLRSRRAHSLRLDEADDGVHGHGAGFEIRDRSSLIWVPNTVWQQVPRYGDSVYSTATRTCYASCARAPFTLALALAPRPRPVDEVDVFCTHKDWIVPVKHGGSSLCARLAAVYINVAAEEHVKQLALCCESQGGSKTE